MTAPWDEFGPIARFDVARYRGGSFERTEVGISTEIPFTIVANEVEVATLMCSPSDLREMAYGFLFSSSFIRHGAEVTSYSLDAKRWVATLALDRTPDPSLMAKRLYTAGCGKGVMYTNLGDLSSRRPIESSLTIEATKVVELSRWLQQCSKHYREAGGIHTAALSVSGRPPTIYFDDIGRHNAVDKVIGRGLLDRMDFGNAILISSGRTSSEILHKAQRAGLPITISRGSPTHQSILRARETGITLIGFARGGGFTVYSHEERVHP